MWIIYLADVLPTLSVIMAIVSIVALAIAASLWSGSNKTGIPDAKKIFLVFIPTFFICLLVPGKQTIYMMAGVEFAQEIASSPKTKELGGKVLNLINKKLDEELEKKK